MRRRGGASCGQGWLNTGPATRKLNGINWVVRALGGEGKCAILMEGIALGRGKSSIFGPGGLLPVP